MKLLDIPFDDRRRRYLIFHPRNLPDRLRLASTTTTAAFEALGSSRFYVSQDQRILAKVVPDKYRKQRQPLKWMYRDYLEKRLLMQSDARKEFLSRRILRHAGLRVPDCYGWGISFNPANRNPSLLLMEQLHNARVGGEVFDELDEDGRQRFLEHFCQEVVQLAHAGYVHRDLHYNNLMVDDQGHLNWIDAHVRPLPRRTDERWPAIQASLTASKLRGEAYRSLAECRIGELWAGKPAE
ncbi:lipopolysaccharide kinase InaA family protein [Halomonas caseinilytica]|uniref:lipopolysaccharide kinase InaA family protein n=1 Tax=Halomonas caseinilytica TaxID=438744 RepID=UPI0007E583D6|nr:lipopolysaccharide kinase InaA family protein [Halomonas caseinilytica]SEM90884.1 Lipopolysaccharide kinase (Kdo/WaaP) family protein [Halomonas caseinilytica]